MQTRFLLSTPRVHLSAPDSLVYFAGRTVGKGTIILELPLRIRWFGTRRLLGKKEGNSAGNEGAGGGRDAGGTGGRGEGRFPFGNHVHIYVKLPWKIP